LKHPIIISIDGTSGSGKSTVARRIARALGFAYVDTGAMYRTLAWYCLTKRVDPHDPKAVASLCRRWKTSLECVPGEFKQVRLLVDGYFPEKEIRTEETSGAVPHVAAVHRAREWMKKTQRDCIRFGSLVMEGRDIGTNVFPETDFKFYIDAPLEERTKRRHADGVKEDLAQRDQRDSQRASAPLMIPLGARVILNANRTADDTAAEIIAEVERRQRAATPTPAPAPAEA
jgi:cytidylate kinase